MPIPRSMAIAILIPILAIASVGSYVVIASETGHGSPAPVSSPASSCTAQPGYGLAASSTTVLVINSGSTGRICVKYTNSLNNTGSTQSYFTVYQYNSSGGYGVCADCQFNVVTQEFGLTASPANFTYYPSSPAQSETVTYTISVPANVTSGVYGVFLLQFCSLFPVVVVPDSASGAQLNSSEFSSWYPHEGSCPAQFLTAQVLGVGGFEAEQVPDDAL